MVMVALLTTKNFAPQSDNRPECDQKVISARFARTQVVQMATDLATEINDEIEKRGGSLYLLQKPMKVGMVYPFECEGAQKKKPVRVNENLEPVAYFNVNWKGHTALGHDLEIIKAWASKVVKNIDEAVQKGARFAAGNLGSVWFDVDTNVDGKEKKVRVSASRVSAAVRPRHRPIIKYMIMLDATFDEEW